MKYRMYVGDAIWQKSKIALALKPSVSPMNGRNKIEDTLTTI